MSKQAHKEKSTEVSVTADSKALTAQASLSMDDLAADAGSGLQNVTATDLAMPIIRLLQSNSKQCKRSEGVYIPGAVEGMMLNNVSNELYDSKEGIRVIPAYWEKVYIEWKPDRGGLAGIHPVNTPLKDQVTMKADKEGKLIPTLPNGNSLSETNQHYCLIIKDNGSFEPAVISMASSQLKPSRIWNSLMKKIVLQMSNGQHFTPASYYMTYKLTTMPVTKDNNSWYVFKVETAGETPTKELYQAAKAFEKAVSSGKVQVKHDDGIEVEHEAPADPASTNDADDNIPF